MTARCFFFSLSHALFKSHYESKIFTVFVLHLFVFLFVFFIFFISNCDTPTDFKCLLFFSRWLRLVAVCVSLFGCCFFSLFSLMSVVISVLPSKLTSKSWLWRPFVYWKRYSRACKRAPKIEMKTQINIYTLGSRIKRTQHKETTYKKYKMLALQCAFFFFRKKKK